MGGIQRKYLKLLISLFILISLPLSLYFSSHLSYYFRCHSTLPQYNSHLPSQFNQTQQLQQQHVITNKPWPILPSYLPWFSSLTSKTISFRSCEAYFGNGFTHHSPSRSLPKPSSPADENGGRLRCYYIETLQSSICEGGSLRMHPEKIKMSTGGEVIESVIGRAVDEELPVFEPGAFDILELNVSVVDDKKSNNIKKLVSEGLLNAYLQIGQIVRHTMRDHIDSILLVPRNL